MQASCSAASELLLRDCRLCMVNLRGYLVWQEVSSLFRRQTVSRYRISEHPRPMKGYLGLCCPRFRVMSGPEWRERGPKRQHRCADVGSELAPRHGRGAKGSTHASSRAKWQRDMLRVLCERKNCGQSRRPESASNIFQCNTTTLL